MSRRLGFAIVLLGTCLCNMTAAQDKLSYSDIVGRLSGLRRLAEPPGKG